MLLYSFSHMRFIVMIRCQSLGGNCCTRHHHRILAISPLYASQFQVRFHYAATATMLHTFSTAAGEVCLTCQ